jgi:TonB-dependent SusC/RagA subfamily outer membrane receptor
MAAILSLFNRAILLFYLSFVTNERMIESTRGLKPGLTKNQTPGSTGLFVKQQLHYLQKKIMTRLLKFFGLGLLMLICATTISYGQSTQITGTVISPENKQPLAGVTVTVKETKTSVVTNAQGKFSIAVPSTDATLVFTGATFVTREEKIDGRSVIDVEMIQDVKAMSDVVVIGYQTVRRKDLLASVSSVGARDLKDNPINSAAEALNGRLAGVTATTSEGSPDATIRIRVRGGMSITGSNEPLYVIDGVQVENGLSTLSPQDIQTVDVLKDAAATAIYGARGSNGVFIITTKSGKPGRTVPTS